MNEGYMNLASLQPGLSRVRGKKKYQINLVVQILTD